MRGFLRRQFWPLICGSRAAPVCPPETRESPGPCSIQVSSPRFSRPHFTRNALGPSPPTSSPRGRSQRTFLSSKITPKRDSLSSRQEQGY